MWTCMRRTMARVGLLAQSGALAMQNSGMSADAALIDQGGAEQPAPQELTRLVEEYNAGTWLKDVDCLPCFQRAAASPCSDAYSMTYFFCHVHKDTPQGMLRALWLDFTCIGR
jgi:hypothetical protein